MPQVNVGTTPNDSTGDPLRTAFIKINESIAALQEGIEAIAQLPDAVALVAAREAAQLAAQQAAAAEAAAELAAAEVIAATESILPYTGLATPSAPGFMAAADKAKLDGVAAGATANATNAQLRDRSTHTGDLNNTPIGTTTRAPVNGTIGSFNNGVEPGNLSGHRDYSTLVRFSNDVAGTWRTLATIVSQNLPFSGIGFVVDVYDNLGNTVQTTGVASEAPRIERFFVLCVRADATTLNVPDACIVRGPSDRIRAVKTAVGAYEIQIQNQTQFRDYRVEISVYEFEQNHTVNYFAGTAPAPAGIAQYPAIVTNTTPRQTVSTADPSGGLDGDIWVKVPV